MTFKWIIALGLLVSASAFGETYKVDAKIYSVFIAKPKTDAQANGVMLDVGKLVHGTIVNSNGDTSSQWCRDTYAHKNGKQIAGGGNCIIIDEDGDFMWVWMRPTGENKSEWGVFNGSGKWKGAKGGGTTELDHQNPDIDSWVLTFKGEIER